MIKIQGQPVQLIHFPDGTQKIDLPEAAVNAEDAVITLVWTYEKEEEFATLIYVTLHLKNICPMTKLELYMPYIPNARMDRIHEKTEVFTLKHFAQTLNWLGFCKVYTLDAHSNVSAGLIDRMESIPVKAVMERAMNDAKEAAGDGKALILYFPDEGAMKRYASMFPGYECCFGSKVRDWKTGTIRGLEIHSQNTDLHGRTVLMMDDIIAYGGSFYYSAQELKKAGADKIFAYATHTENSVLDQEKGTFLRLLNDGGVERLYTTNSLFTGAHPRITAYDFENFIR